MKLFSFYFLLLLFFLLSANLFSQTDSLKIYHLSDVVVTATKTKMPLIELASSISVIDSEEIASSKKTNLFDLLKNQSGLSFTQQGGQGMLANVFLRGSEAGHSLILIDGIEVNMTSDPDNVFDFSYLSANNINRIEVLRGPQSVLYGSNALGGVINIITQDGSGKPKFSLITEGGSYNTYRAAAGLNGSYNLLSYSLSLGRIKTDGFSSASEKFGNTEKDGHSSYDVSSKIGLSIMQNFTLNLFYRFTDAESDNDQFGGTFGDDPSYIFDLQEFFYKAEADLKLFSGLWSQTADVTFFRNTRKYSFDSTFFNSSSSRSFYDGRKLKFGWQNNLNFNRSYSAVFGIETENEEALSEYYSSIFSPSILPSSEARTTGIYLQNQINFDNSFYASIGGRIDKHELFDWAFTYRIAPAYIFWETSTKIKATFGTGFRVPSLFNLFHPTFGNKELNPEKSIGWDAGMEQFLSFWNLNFGLTYFQNYFDDLFGYDASSRRTINTEKALTNGIETYLNINPVNGLSIKANYTYMQTEDKSENSADKGKELLRRPKHKAGISLIYNFLKDVNGNLEIIYIGKRDDIDFSIYERLKLKDYTLVNLALSYKLLNITEIFGRVENLFDTEYEEVFGYGTAGLSGYAGIKLTF
jgi:vitamin B12 transporter